MNSMSKKKSLRSILVVVLCIFLLTSCAKFDGTNTTTSYSFIEFNESTSTGAVFLTTVEDVMARVEKTSIFKKDSDELDCNIVDMKDGTTSYVFAETPYDALQIIVDNKTNYIVSAGWIADMRYYNISNSDDVSEICAKAAVIMSFATGKYEDSLSSEFYTKWINEVVENPIEINAQMWSISYNNGVVLQVTDLPDDFLMIRTSTMSEDYYNNWIN